eukprot:214670-Chlamydomonas_euryale.AAC.1
MNKGRHRLRSPPRESLCRATSAGLPLQDHLCRALSAGLPLQGSLCRATHAGLSLQGSLCRAPSAGPPMQGQREGIPPCPTASREGCCFSPSLTP